MDPRISPFISGLFLALVGFLYLLTLAAIPTFGALAGLPKERAARLTTRTLLVLSGWLFVTGYLAWSGFFLNFNTVPPRVLLALLPTIIAIVVVGRSATAGQLISAAPPAWLIFFHTFRILMEIILWLLFVTNVIPIQMSFEGRNFDILAGLTAPVVAYLCFVRRVWSPRVALVWNFLALGLLLNIVVTAALSIPGPIRVFMNEPANTLVAYVPFIWLPTFVVPLTMLVHVLSIRQLWPGQKGMTQP